MNGLRTHALGRLPQGSEGVAARTPRGENTQATLRSEGSQPLEDLGLETGKQDARKLAAGLHGGEHRSFQVGIGTGGTGLQLQVQFHPRCKAIEDLLEQGNLGSAAGVEPSNFPDHRVSHGPPSPDAPELRVVNDHDRAVPRLVEVEFEHVGTLLDGERERAQGILWARDRRPAMSDDEGRSSRAQSATQFRERSTARFQPA